MRRILLAVCFLVLCSAVSTVSADTVMDIYTGKGTPCADNTTYTYDATNLKYACIITKSDGKTSLLVNGTEDLNYNGVESAYFDYSGKLVASLHRDGLYALRIGNTTSLWYPYVPSQTSDGSGNTIISFQNNDGYGWIYNGETRLSKSPYNPYISTIFSASSIIVLDNTRENPLGYAYWYDRAFINGKQVLTDYSALMYQGEYTKSNTTVGIFLAQKGKKVEVLALKKDGKFLKLMSVPGTLNENTSFTVNYENFSQFAFVIKDGEKFRIATEMGLQPGLYESVGSLWYYQHLGLYKQVVRDEKYYFSIGNKGYGPFETIGNFNTSTSGKSWYINVTKNGKEFLLVNGKEVSL